MTSILTHRASTSALSVLRMSRNDLDRTLSRLATGLKVKSAADGASYWAIAMTLRGDNGTLDTLKSDLGLGLAAINAASAGLSATMNDLSALAAKLTSALSGQTDRGKIQTEIAALQQAMRTNAGSASAGGRNWLSIDSSAANPLWRREETFVTGVPRAQDGTIAIKSQSLDVTSVALFDANTVATFYPIVYGSFPVDPLHRVALDINATPGLNAQVRADVVDGALRLYSVDPARTVTGTSTDDGGPPVAGTAYPQSQFLNASVSLPIASLSSGDVFKVTVSGGTEQSFTVTNQADTLDFSGGNEVHLALRPHGTKFPGVVYDVLVNGSTLTGTVPDVSKVSRAELYRAISNRIGAEFAAKYQGTYTWSEVGIAEVQDGWTRIAFQAASFGPQSSIEVGIQAATPGHTLIDVGFGTLPAWPGAAAAQAPGFQELDRRQKGILDSYDGTTRSSVAGASDGLVINALTSTTEMQAYIRQVNAALDQVTDAAVRLGGLKTRLTDQMAFSDTIRQINTSAIGTLVDADIETESTRLKALQAQRDLSVQALSLANASSQGLLTLFQ